MKTPRIKLFCVSLIAILTSITISSAKEHEGLVYSESSDMISEVEGVNYLDCEVYYNYDSKTVAASLMYDCMELRRVWVWSGWLPQRVWKWVRVTCPLAAGGRGPGTTIPPH